MQKIKNQIILITHTLFIALLLWLDLSSIGDNASMKFFVSIPVFIYIWIFFSTYKLGFNFAHPYFLFLFSFLGFILWNNVTTLLGITNFWENVYIGEFFFKDPIIQKKTYLLMSYSMCFFHLGAIIAAILWGTTLKDCPLDYQTPKIRFFQHVCKHLYWLSVPLYILYISFFVYAVLTQGYFVLYGNDQIQSPALLGLSDDISRSLFWMYVLTKPSQKDSKYIFISYLIITLLSLGMGSRGLTFCELLALLSLRLYWGYPINFKKIIIIGSALIILSPIIYFVRLKNDVRIDQNFVTELVGQQGLPLISIAATLHYEDELPKNKHMYLFGPIIEFGQSITNRIGLTNIKMEDNINNLVRLPQVISYKFDSNSFLDGWGMGDSFIGEFYTFGGIIGLCILSFFYILLILKLFMHQKYFFGLFCCYYSLRYFLFTVRENPTYMLVSLIIPIAIYFTLWLLYYNNVVAYPFKKCKKY